MDFLTIDWGNSNPHVGLFISNQLTKIQSWNDFKKEFSFHSLPWVGSLVGNFKEVEEFNSGQFFQNQIRLPILQNKNFLDMKVDYANSLGLDRLYESYFLFSNLKNNQTKQEHEGIILVDCGTFTTLNYISHFGFIGGSIIPGIQTYLQTYQNGFRLPENKFNISLSEKSKQLYFPQTTAEALSSGFELFLNGICEHLFRSLMKLPVRKWEIILTGGNASHLLEKFSDYNFSFKNSNDTEFEIIKIVEVKHLIHHALAFLFKKSFSLKVSPSDSYKVKKDKD